MGDVKKFVPLSPASLHILIALAAEDLHGYGIMQEVARQSANQYNLSAATLYDNISKLLAQKLIEAAVRRDTDGRRRFYKLTSLGKSVVTAEIARLEGVFRKVKSHLQPLRPRKA